LYRFAGNKDGAFPNSALVFDGNGRLYGSTVLGGDTTAQDCIIVDNVSGCGTVFQLAISGGVARKAVLHTFTGAPDDGKYPSTLVLDDQHNLYSATEQGGNVGFGNGTIFELTREQTGWTENILYNFAGGTDAMRPLGGLVRDTTGNLYGTSQLGGDTSCGQGFGCGVVFRWSPQ
jgi:hypothetical protein